MVRRRIPGTDRNSREERNHRNYFCAPNGSFTDNNFMMLKKVAYGLERRAEVRNPETDGPERNNVFTFLKLTFKGTIALNAIMSCNDNRVNWHSQSDFPQQGDGIAGCHTLCCRTKRDFFRENNYTVFPTIQFLLFLLRLNEGSNKYGHDENFCDVDICPLTAKTVLYT